MARSERSERAVARCLVARSERGAWWRAVSAVLLPQVLHEGVDAWWRGVSAVLGGAE